MSARYCSSWHRPALTLLEVVTALALLSTLLVGMLVAFQKNAQRIGVLVEQRRIVAGVDQLLLRWSEQGLFPPAAARGVLPDVDGYLWETHLTSRRYRASLGLDIVTLDVRAAKSADPRLPLLSLELPVPASGDGVAEEGPGL